MSDGDQNHGKHEIIIVKRRGGDHEGGHGVRGRSPMPTS